MFVILTSLSQWDSDSTNIFLNQLIQFYSNNAINLHQLTTHSTTCSPTKWRSHCDHRYVTSLHPMYKDICYQIIFFFEKCIERCSRIRSSARYRQETVSPYSGDLPNSCSNSAKKQACGEAVQNSERWLAHSGDALRRDVGPSTTLAQLGKCQEDVFFSANIS